MDWNARLLVRGGIGFLVLSTVVVVAILRLGGVIAWPSHGIAIAAIFLVSSPVLILLFAVGLSDTGINDEGSGWNVMGRIFDFFTGGGI